MVGWGGTDSSAKEHSEKKNCGDTNLYVGRDVRVGERRFEKLKSSAGNFPKDQCERCVLLTHLWEDLGRLGKHIFPKSI